MRYWNEINQNQEIIRAIVMNKSSIAEDLNWIQKNLGGTWVLDEGRFQWKAPVEYPTDGKDYFWNEETTSWVEIPQDGE